MNRFLNKALSVHLNDKPMPQLFSIMFFHPNCPSNRPKFKFSNWNSVIRVITYLSDNFDNKPKYTTKINT